MLWMPGRSHQGPLPPLTKAEAELRDRLRRHVERLAGEIGERNLLWRYEALKEAALYVETALGETGLEVTRQDFEVEGRTVSNLEGEKTGATRPGEIVVVGGHYDSVLGCPGANDNGTGSAAVLEIARLLAGRELARTVRFVGFVNEEPPFFQTPMMGSVRYARRARERGETVVAMLSLETIGYYTGAPASQRYPFPFSVFYPSVGNFIGVVGDLRSASLVRRVVGSFRRHTAFPSEGAAAPGWITGVGWSDQWSFWRQGYRAVMVTDTAPFRYAAYHTAEDTPEKIDYESTARVVAGMARVVEDLASGP